MGAHRSRNAGGRPRAPAPSLRFTPSLPSTTPRTAKSRRELNATRARAISPPVRRPALAAVERFLTMRPQPPPPSTPARLRRRRTGVLLAAVVVAIGVVAVAVTRHGGGHQPAQADVRLVVDRLGRQVPASFVGLSIEWDSLAAYAGSGTRARAELLRLLAPVRRAAGSPLALRVGGDSTDQAWWDPSGRRPRPPTVLQALGPGTLDEVAWLARGLGGPVTLGVNLALRDPANATALVRAARRRLPSGSLAALELGNEPDLYTTGRVFTRGGHVHRRVVKDPNYDLDDYMRDAGAYARALAAVAGGAALVGAGFAGPAWWPALPDLLQRSGGRIDALAAHLYALPRCDGPTPSPAWLASRAASRARAASLQPLLDIGRREHVPVRVGELGSAPCGGRPGLSDAPAAALWTADMLLALLREGVSGADLHTWAGAAYAPFVVSGSTVRPRPPLTGMEAFARAAPSGSRLVRTIAGGAVRGGATVDRAGTVRALLIAPRAATATVRLTVAGGDVRRGRCASVWRALPPGTARASAPSLPARVCPDAAGAYAIPLPAMSMAVLTVDPATS
jgi:hypothetical protein